jgi:hypothetical protein
MMKELRTPVDLAALLPGGSDELFMVLFWRSSEPLARAARRSCADFVWPRPFRPVSVDLDRASDVDAWFCLNSVPILAVVTDGAILGMEFDCTPEACRKLAECGRSQYSMMRSLSS